MQFTKAVVLAFATAAAAVPTTPTGNQVQCNAETTSCCSDTETASGTLASLLSLLNLNADIGIKCVPVNILQVTGARFCNAETVCCQTNSGDTTSSGGLVNLNLLNNVNVCPRVA